MILLTRALLSIEKSVRIENNCFKTLVKWFDVKFSRPELVFAKFWEILNKSSGSYFFKKVEGLGAGVRWPPTSPGRIRRC